jgi:hypothetical protein
MVQLPTDGPQYSDESAKFATTTKNSDRNDAPEDPLKDIDVVIRRPECTTDNYFQNSVDFARDGSHAYVADGILSEEFTLDSRGADTSAETGSFDNVLTVISQIPRIGR